MINKQEAWKLNKFESWFGFEILFNVLIKKTERNLLQQWIESGLILASSIVIYTVMSGVSPSTMLSPPSKTPAGPLSRTKGTGGEPQTYAIKSWHDLQLCPLQLCLPVLYQPYHPQTYLQSVSTPPPLLHLHSWSHAMMNRRNTNKKSVCINVCLMPLA